MSGRYVLTAEAEADLRGIIRYTERQWGAAQVRAYMAKLTRGIERLASSDSSFREMGELRP